jgi:drug/metabolite transporter (DMT)-like permease
VIGEVCALLAALVWAIALVLFKRSGERIPPLALNLFKNLVAMVLLAVTLLAVPAGSERLGQFSAGDYAVLALSGVLGIAVSDTLFFEALNLIGVGLVSIVDCMYSPFVVVFAFLLLGEALSPMDYLGMGLVLAGVLLATRHAPPGDRTRGQIILGVLLGVLSMAFMTFGIVYAKPVLEGADFPLLWATQIRLVAGIAALVAYMLISPRRGEYWQALKPSPVWKLSLPASFLGTYLAMIFWVAGFKYAQAAVAGILNQTSLVFSIVLAAILLKEPFTRRKLAAVVLAMAGVAIVTLG